MKIPLSFETLVNKMNMLAEEYFMLDEKMQCSISRGNRINEMCTTAGLIAFQLG